MRFSNHPLFLLLSTGLALGLYFPLGKHASAAGFHPLVWSLVISLVPGLALYIASAITDRSGWPVSLVPFGLISGLTAYVIPNSLVFAAIPHAGSGYVALMFALSPVFTALLSIALGVRPPERSLLAGVAFGFAGAALIVLSRFQIGLQGNAWPLIALVIPVSLAIGNVYRTAYWPKGIAALRVGAVANLGALPFYAAILVVVLPAEGLVPFKDHAALALSQCLLSLAMFLVFFRLQWVGGPTFLSQIGYVAAAVGLGVGSLYFGESYTWPVWAGAGLIAIGILVSTRPPRG